MTSVPTAGGCVLALSAPVCATRRSARTTNSIQTAAVTNQDAFLCMRSSVVTDISDLTAADRQHPTTFRLYKMTSRAYRMVRECCADTTVANSTSEYAGAGPGS